MKTTVRSLQELKSLKSTLEQLRAEAAARIKAEQEQRQQAERAQRLFTHAVGPVQPLPSRHHDRAPVRSQPAPPRPLQRERDQQAVLQEALSDVFDVTTLLETDESLSYRRPSVGADVVRKLRQGHWSIQNQLDLHGLRRDGAREMLTLFIRECQRRGIRCVRIVTGKGLGSPGKTPVIKHKMYGWLIQKQEVLAFVQARPAEGGAGALIVLLAPAAPSLRAGG